MKKVIYFHRNLKAGYSINKVTQTVVRLINPKEEYYLPTNRATPIAMIRNIWFVFRHREKDCYNHLTGDAHYCMLALLGCKSILTVHDTSEYILARTSYVKRKLLEYLMFRIPFRCAGQIVCISEATKQTVLKYTDRKDIKVIHNAVPISPSFGDASSIHSPFRVLIVGTRVNKNVERSLMALPGLDCQITIIGTLSEKQSSIIEAKSLKVINKNNLTDDELATEYRNTDLVLFCSLYEGFGMPIIEANSYGKAVLTSNLPVLMEVGGDAAMYVDPMNEESIRNGVETIMRDEKLRSALIERGYKNVERFTPEHISKQWMTLYK